MKEIKRLIEVAILIIKEVIDAFKGEHKKEESKSESKISQKENEDNNR